MIARDTEMAQEAGIRRVENGWVLSVRDFCRDFRREWVFSSSADLAMWVKRLDTDKVLAK